MPDEFMVFDAENIGLHGECLKNAETVKTKAEKKEIERLQDLLLREAR